MLVRGVGQKPGETRLQLLRRNAAVSARSCPAVLAHAPDAVLVVATNPVDVMTHLAARSPRSSAVAGRACSVPARRWTRPVSARLLGTHCGVDPHHVHGYVVGEHGDSEVLTWSLVTIGGMPLEAFARMRGVDLSDGVRQRHRREGAPGRVHDHRRQRSDLLRHRQLPWPGSWTWCCTTSGRS